ncbi:tRNA pseudouridine(38/39) synthase isoform X2 [Phoenix dactylifera]|uniref:tRNA pseudouridine(38/39) synthase isoform X2 n=1 Tax=Phoenix dactylifera TaxID=42345 RepID=A0A8B8JDU3_PHODC|nr:tRNA pseudouridine(38/39) synthase isoform X2 [Phoenix dactylifera]
MATEGGLRYGVQDHPMEVSKGHDLVAVLQSQLASIGNRVEELEKENERLLSRISRCRCSKEEDATFPSNAATSLEGALQEDQQNELHAAENSELAKISSSNHLFMSSSNSVKDEITQANGFHVENTAKFIKHESREEPGHHPRTVHHFAKRYIALKIMYFGQRFYGFASEAQMTPTVESEIFKALERTKLLVGKKEDSHYSRCGRTDKGVSSTGQVISLYLRSCLKGVGANSKSEESTSEEKCEIDYVKVLNKVLPKDIRVLGWCPVSTDFHARFSCLSREYRYLFWKGNLDIVAMQEAAKKFIGEHDFRNFCKMDAANVNNYKRHITIFDISSSNKRFSDNELWAMTIRGSAFLWHQVRCMVAVLFMIGQGLESPNIVDVLLDTDNTWRKPQYNMAPELPLILHFCKFESVNFICSSDASRVLHEHLKNEFRSYMMQAAIFHEALGCLPIPDGSSAEAGRKKKGHIPLMLSPTEPSYDERRAKLNAKATHKSLPNYLDKRNHEAN